MRLRNILFANTAVQLIGKIVTSASSFVITICIARWYGTTGYGDYIKVITFATVWYIIVDFGFNAVFLQQVQNKQKTPVFFSNLLWLRILWSVVLAIIATGILLVLPYNPITRVGFSSSVKIAIFIMIPTLLTYGIHLSYNALFQKLLRYDKSVIAASAGALVTLLFIVYFSFSSAPLRVVMGAYVLGGVIVALISIYFGRKQISIKESIRRFSASEITTLFISSVPLGLTLIVSLVNFRADIFILSVFRSSEEVGIYGLATKLFEFQLVLPVFYMNALYPILLSAFHHTEKRLNLIKKSFYMLILLSILVFFGGLLVSSGFGFVRSEFVLSSAPFRVLSLSLPLFYVTALFMWILIAAGKRWVLFGIYGVGALCNIALNCIFIPAYGYMAAAVTTGISEAIVLLLLLYHARSYIIQKKSV